MTNHSQTPLTNLASGMIFEDKNSYLRVSCRGQWNSDLVLENLLEIKKEAGQTNHTRILLDCLEIGPPRFERDRIAVGQDIAYILKSPLKVAALYPAKFTNRVAEKIAINRGVIYRVFAEESEALAWLLSDSV
ncbi:MAG: hypothetical protein VKJ02_10650 [Snowella sp.]|nr:hypothetical protein [Snowella sp.]